MARDLIKWSHLPTISSLQNEMNRMLDRFFKSGDISDFEMETGAWIPPIDLAETDEKFHRKGGNTRYRPKGNRYFREGQGPLNQGREKRRKRGKG